MPSLIAGTQKHEYVSGLRKAYSTLAAASQAVIAEEGLPKCNEGGWACSAEEIFNILKEHLNYVKECGTSEKECFPAGTSGSKSMILADGTSLRVWRDIYQNCSGSGDGSDNVCAFINIDVNGLKKPNRGGKDIFSFVLKADGIHPAGCDKEAENCTVHHCTCRVLRENAMNY